MTFLASCATSHVMDASPLGPALRSRGLKYVELANRLNVNKAAVSRWVRGRVPAERVLPIERLTGISRHELRPDLYPREYEQFEAAE